MAPRVQACQPARQKERDDDVAQRRTINLALASAGHESNARQRGRDGIGQRKAMPRKSVSGKQPKALGHRHHAPGPRPRRSPTLLFCILALEQRRELLLQGVRAAGVVVPDWRPRRRVEASAATCPMQRVAAHETPRRQNRPLGRPKLPDGLHGVDAACRQKTARRRQQRRNKGLVSLECGNH